MTREAAQIGSDIAKKVQSLRAEGMESDMELEALVGQLSAASANSLADALALAAIARRMLHGVLGEVAEQDIAAISQDNLIGLVALQFLHRCVETLEGLTGLSGEGFTGEAGTLN